MAIPRIVIDTNVLVSALRTKRGASYRLIELCGSALFEHVISIPLVFEYEAMCRFLLPDFIESEALFQEVIDSAIQTGISYLIRPFLSDPRDEMVLEAAVNGQCDYLVTFNQKDFVGAKEHGIVLIKPGDFLTRIGR